MLSDLRAALRGLLRDRAFTFFSVLALALGLGLNATLLTLTRTLLLRPAPVARPDGLLQLQDVSRRDMDPDAEGSQPAFEAARTLEDMATVGLVAPGGRRLLREAEGQAGVNVTVGEASVGYLEACGVRAFLGRGFQAEDTGTPVVVLSHALWRTRFQGDAGILGRTLQLNGRPHRVVGVLPEGFQGHQVARPMDLLLPRNPWPLPGTSPVHPPAQVLVRLKPGFGAAQAQARLDAMPWHADFSPRLTSYRPMGPQMQARLTQGLAALHGASLLVLLIGLANVLGLQAARLQKRRPEMALRTALGARGGDLFRLVLMENLVLALLSGVGALGLAAAAGPFLAALRALVPYSTLVVPALGPWVAMATLGLAAGVGVILALLVRIQAGQPDLVGSLKGLGGRATGLRTRSLLVAAQAALALVLLTTAGLYLRDLQRRMDLPLGFEVRDRVVVSLEPGKAGRPRTDLLPLLEPLVARVQGLPGVRGAALAANLPLTGNTSQDDAPVPHLELTGHSNLMGVLGAQVKEGRALVATDEGSGRVLVSEGFARRAWPGQSALGRTWQSLGVKEVVGVLPDLYLQGTEKTPAFVVIPEHTFHGPVREGMPLDTLVVHLDPQALPGLRRLLDTELKGLPFTVQSLETLREDVHSGPRQMLLLSATMGALALLLSLAGLYGLAAHLTDSRRRELGLRVALGAGPGRILTTLAQGSLLPLLPGLGLGALLAVAASRLLVSQQTGFLGLDLSLLLGCGLLLGLAAALATLLPALRVLRVNPSQALRME